MSSRASTWGTACMCQPPSIRCGTRGMGWQLSASSQSGVALQPRWRRFCFYVYFFREKKVHVVNDFTVIIILSFFFRALCVVCWLNMCSRCCVRFHCTFMSSRLLVAFASHCLCLQLYACACLSSLVDHSRCRVDYALRLTTPTLRSRDLFAPTCRVITRPRRLIPAPFDYPLVRVTAPTRRLTTRACCLTAPTRRLITRAPHKRAV